MYDFHDSILTFLDKSCNAHMLHASGVYYSGICYQGLILNLGRSCTTFGTKIPVFRANSGTYFRNKMAKMMAWIYKNDVSRIVKIVHSAFATPH